MPKINKAYNGKRVKRLAHVARKPQSRETKDAIAKFRDSKAWENCQLYTLNHEPICRLCKTKAATSVHHIITLDEDFPGFEHSLAADNLVGLCLSCHAKVSHIERIQPDEAKKMFRKKEDK